MINYIVQVLLFQGLFLIVYDLFLSKETFFTKNRWYLLGTFTISFLIPLLRIPTLQKIVSQETTSVVLPEIIISPQGVIEQTSFRESLPVGTLVFWLGVLVFLSIFLLKIYRLIKILKKNNVKKYQGYKLVSLSNSRDAFSFYNYIFLGDNINNEERGKIIKHELIHCSQRHSLDLLFFEILKVIMWFNPLVYLYQKRIAAVHEYIADDIVVQASSKTEYINKLMNELFGVENISFVNQFSIQSLIKKRIFMITKEKSNPIKQLKYLLFIPLAAATIIYSAFTKVERSELLDSKNAIPVLEKSIVSMGKQSIDAVPNKKPTPVKIEVLHSIHELDVLPEFPGCQEGNKDCFNKGIKKHFANKFNVEIPIKLGLKPEMKRLLMMFVIDCDGSISGIRVKAPHPKLEEEAIRVLKLLPKMKPGVKNGCWVATKYILPMKIDVK